MNNKQLLQQALDVLVNLTETLEKMGFKSAVDFDRTLIVMEALQAAIAQPKPNPIGYLMKNSWDFVPGNEPPEGESDAVYMEPVQSAYVPLHQELIFKAYKTALGQTVRDKDEAVVLAFGQAIEKAVRGEKS